MSPYLAGCRLPCTDIARTLILCLCRGERVFPLAGTRGLAPSIPRASLRSRPAALDLTARPAPPSSRYEAARRRGVSCI